MRLPLSLLAVWMILGTGLPVFGGQRHESARLGHAVGKHVDYHARVYYGAYYRGPYNYRNKFDFPWHAGPSRAHWPIAAPEVNYCQPGPKVIVTPYQ